MATITLNPDKTRPVLQRHPWVFSGAVASVKGYVGRGDAIDVCDSHGQWLARGTWSSGSQIRARLFTWNAEEPLDIDLLQHRIARAAASRANRPEVDPEACRLIYGESDGLPGLIVDRFGAFLVVQLLTQGMAARSEQITKLLAEQFAPRGIYERSDAEIREKEDLPPQEGVLWGEAPPDTLVFEQGGMRYQAALQHGQKTGFYLDQAVNRRRVAAYCHGADVLDGFCYTGGFTLHAAQAGAASIIAADSSGPALQLLQENLALNAAAAPVEIVEFDMFRLLRQYRAEGRTFDVVILDPPKFAHSHGQLERATRGYKDINLIAMQLLRPGGYLATFSCSGLVSSDLFQKVVFGAAIDAKRDVQIVERLTQAPDHPVLLTFPESEYLKGLICQVW